MDAVIQESCVASCLSMGNELCPLLETCAMSEINRVARIIQIDRGHQLVAQGDPQSSIFVIQAGAIKLYRMSPDGQSQVLDFLRAGDLFGNVNGRNTSFSSAIALEATVCCQIDRASYKKLISTQPKFATTLLSAAAHEIEILYHHTMLLARKRVDERIAAFLLIEREKASRRGNPIDEPLTLPMSRQDIADFVGSTNETVCRILTRMKKRGLIEMETPNRVLIIDADVLHEMTGLDIEGPAGFGMGL